MMARSHAPEKPEWFSLFSDSISPPKRFGENAQFRHEDSRQIFLGIRPSPSPPFLDELQYIGGSKTSPSSFAKVKCCARIFLTSPRLMLLIVGTVGPSVEPISKKRWDSKLLEKLCDLLSNSSLKKKVATNS
jgi:hypothetical protein